MPVFLSRQSSYHVAELTQQVDTAIERIGLSLKGRSAVIKPNLVNQFGNTSGTTTHPAVVEAVYNALRERGFTEITIADGPSINRPVDEVFRNSGMTELAARLGVPLVDLNQAPRRLVPWKY